MPPLYVGRLMRNWASYQSSTSSKVYRFRVGKSAVEEMESFLNALLEKKMALICEHINKTDGGRKTILERDVIWAFSRVEE